MREAAKSTLVALLEPIRTMVLETGRRMEEAHLLDKGEDVFYLTWADLLSFLEGEWDGEGARALVTDAKAQHAAWLSEHPADVVVGDHDGSTIAAMPAGEPETTWREASPPTRTGESGESGESDKTLRGIAASPGQVRGRARILHHPDEGRNLRAGEVLVAPSTDPAWTPLFLRAGAVVMETGGYLSRGAIVAREFGIPAVVNIPDLLTRVENGQQMTVDGSRGLVTLRDTPGKP
jgi:pyruvate,water dikinase